MPNKTNTLTNLCCFKYNLAYMATVDNRASVSGSQNKTSTQKKTRQRTLAEITRILKKNIPQVTNPNAPKRKPRKQAENLAKTSEIEEEKLEEGFGKNYQVFKNTAIKTGNSSYKILIAARKALTKEQECLLETEDTEEPEFYGKQNVIEVICDKESLIPIKIINLGGKSRVHDKLDPFFLEQLKEISLTTVPELKEHFKNKLLNGPIEHIDNVGNRLLLKLGSEDKGITCDNRKDASAHSITLVYNENSKIFDAKFSYLRHFFELNIEYADLPKSLQMAIEESLEKEIVSSLTTDFLDENIEIAAQRNDLGFICTITNKMKKINKQNTINLVFNKNNGNSFTLDIKYYGFDLHLTIPASSITSSPLNLTKMKKALEANDLSKLKELLRSSPSFVDLDLNKENNTYTAKFFHCGKKRTIVDLPKETIDSLISSK